MIATEIDHKPSQDEINELCWLYGDATLEDAQQLQGFYVGPRREMITPWSTTAVEITQNMSLNGISRIEEYFPVDSENAEHDPCLLYTSNVSIEKLVDQINESNQYIRHLVEVKSKSDSLNMVLTHNLTRSLSQEEMKEVDVQVLKGVVYISLADNMLYQLSLIHIFITTGYVIHGDR